MRACVSSARPYTSGAGKSIISLVDLSKSPAVVCLRRCFQVMSDELHAFWLPLVGAGRGWSPDTYHLASVPLLVEIGSEWKRFIYALDSWPWRLASLLTDVSVDEKFGIVKELQDASGCCLDAFSSIVKGLCAGIAHADPLPDILVRFLSDVFGSIPHHQYPQRVLLRERSHEGFCKSWECYLS